MTKKHEGKSLKEILDEKYRAINEHKFGLTVGDPHGLDDATVGSPTGINELTYDAFGVTVSDHNHQVPVGVDLAYEMVREFHEKFGHPTANTPTTMSAIRRDNRFEYMDEELQEFWWADNVVDQTDAMIDLIYLALGTLVELGVKPSEPLRIVHEANMTKLWDDGKPRYDSETGKILKPPHFEAPEPKLEAEIERQEGR